MTTLSIEGEIRSLHANRYAPWGYEDKWAREYAKDKTSEITSVTTPRGFVSDSGESAKSYGQSRSERGSKSHAWFRFAKNGKSADLVALGEAISSSFRGALKKASSRIGYGGDKSCPDLTKARLVDLSCMVDVLRADAPAAEPTRVSVPLKSGAGMNWEFFERIPSLDFRATIEADIPQKQLETAVRYIEKLAFGPVRRGRVIVRSVKGA